MTEAPPGTDLAGRMRHLIRMAVWQEALGRTSSVLLPLSDGRADRVPFYCVHALSGAGAVLTTLAEMLGPEQPFVAIQAPVPDRHAGFAGSIEAMARHYAEALMQAQPAGRLALGGWSVGGVIALEMAQYMRARGRHDILLVNIDCELVNVAAAISRRNPLYYWKVAANFPTWLAYDLRDHDWRLRSVIRRFRNKFQALARMARKRIAERRPAHGYAVDGFMDTSRFSADYRAFVRALYDAFYRYVPAAYAGPVVVFEASVQPVVHLRQVGATWRRIAAPEIIPVTGTHESIIKAPDGIALAAELRRRLAAFAAPSAATADVSRRPSPLAAPAPSPQAAPALTPTPQPA